VTASRKLLVPALLALCAGAVALVPACTSSSGSATATPAATSTASANGTWTPLAADTETSTVSPTATRTITRTPSLTNTRTLSWTFSPTWTPTDTATPCTTPQGTSVLTVTVDCWNVYGCSICGTGQLYDCLTGSSTCTFTDPCPGGMTCVEVVASVNGTSCAFSGGFSLDVNGTAVGSISNMGYQCVCNSCTTWCVDSGYFGSGFTGWVSGGTNTLNMTNIASSLCLNNVVLQIGCQ